MSDSNKMNFQMEYWQRIEYQEVPIYFRLDEPDWFVPNKKGDEVLQNLNRNTSDNGHFDVMSVKRGQALGEKISPSP